MFDFRLSVSDLGLNAVQRLFDAMPSLITLAWRPFLDPAPMDRYWLWTLAPLIIVIALVYRTIKSDSLARLPQQSAYLALQIGIFMVLAATALWLLLLFV